MVEFNPTAKADYALQTWFTQGSSDEAARALLAVIEKLNDHRAYVVRRYRRAIELYENVECGNLIAWQFMTTTDIDGRYQYNLVESIVDTIHAEIITNRTKPQFFTDGGDWESKEKAKELTAFISGLFSENEVYTNLAQKVALDALVFGTGFAKVYEKDGKLKAERCFPGEIVVDDVEASLSNGRPRNFYQLRHVPRDTLVHMFADDEEALSKIDSISPASNYGNYNIRVDMDLFQVLEAWHLPSGDFDKGRHLILCNDEVLLDEDYEEEFFPFVVLRYKERMKGWLGKGIPEILEGQQELINDLRDKIDAQVQGSAPFTWVPPGSKLTESEISNRIWRVIESETPPQYVAYNSVPPDLMARFQQEITESSQLVGANALMMRSELPPGINGGSGRALRIYNDTKSKRFMRFARAYESFFLDLAGLFIKIANVCDDDGVDITTRYENGDYIRKMTYGDIRLDEDGMYVIKKEPVNFLSDTPSGRLSDIEALAAIFPDEMKMKLVALLDNPDIKSISDYLNADQDAIGKACSAILRGEKTAGEVAPSQYLDLSLCLQIGRRVLLEAQVEGAPVERILELENWLAMVQSLIEKAAPPAPAPQPQMENVEEIPQ